LKSEVLVGAVGAIASLRSAGDLYLPSSRTL
jgi:hypothetical protein